MVPEIAKCSCGSAQPMIHVVERINKFGPVTPALQIYCPKCGIASPVVHGTPDDEKAVTRAIERWNYMTYLHYIGETTARKFELPYPPRSTVPPAMSKLEEMGWWTK